MENIKNILTIKTIILAATIYLCCALPAAGQTELYKQYRHLKDVTVACIMNFHVNDTTQVELTILAPQTKEAVYYLIEEFNVINLEKDTVDYYYGSDKYTSLHFYNVEKDNIKRFYYPTNHDKDYVNMSKLVYNYNTGTIMVFHNIETEERCDILDRFLIRTLKQPELLPKINKDK